MKSKLHRQDSDGRMLLSSRASPPKPLQFASSRHLSVKHLLLHSPLPSPSLPSILPRHGKKPPPLNTRKVLRLLCWCAIGAICYCLLSWMGRMTSRPTFTSLTNLPYLTSTGKSFEIIGGNELPDYPTPIMVTDRKGRHRWTISIPDELAFPLSATDYADVCAHVREVSQHTAGLHKQMPKTEHLYYNSDVNYVDVYDAQNSGLLPITAQYTQVMQSVPICQRSLTYVLDATDAGFGSNLLGLWISYTLAKREGRAFFIDDTHFAYGSYNNFLVAPEAPACRQPPKAQRVPCPHEAKHLVVSAATFPWTFGSTFRQQFSQRDIYAMAREGYKVLFRSRDADREYAQERIKKLRRQPDHIPNGLIGIHIRRGDRHPFEFAYQHGYLPPQRYLAASQQIVTESSSHAKNWTVFLASDDPEIYDRPEFSELPRAQERIMLASKKNLQQGGLGWEGGFFKDVFWGLGLPLDAQEQKRIGSPLPTRQKKDGGSKKNSALTTGAHPDIERDYRSHPTEQALKLRQLIGRAYLTELEVLGKSDRVVCAVSNYTCRILAVMMGWERAFEKGHWVNVDGNGRYGWIGMDS